MDRISKADRSRVMRTVRREGTSPERAVRSMLHRAGLRFRLHRKDLPGSPDIVLPRHRGVILVHGCFWHSHNCARGRRPESNTQFWNRKLDENVRRDAENAKALRRLGWRVLVIWECETFDQQGLERKLAAWFRRTCVDRTG